MAGNSDYNFAIKGAQVVAHRTSQRNDLETSNAVISLFKIVFKRLERIEKKLNIESPVVRGFEPEMEKKQ